MPIDPRIPLQAQGIQLESPLAQAGSLMQILGAMNQNKLAEAKLAELARSTQRDEATRAALQSLGPNATPQAISQALFASGNYAGAIDFLNKQKDAGRIAAQTEEAKARTAALRRREDAITQYSSLFTPQGYGQGAPVDAVAPNDQSALAMMLAAGADKPGAQLFSVGVPNQGNLSSLLMQIDPAAAMRAQSQNQRGTVVGPGAGYIPPGGTSPTVTMPFAPREPAPTVRVVPNRNSATGFSYEDMRNPGTPLSDAPAPSSGSNAPSGYRFKADGTLEFIPGGPADPKTKNELSLLGGRESVFLNRSLTAANQAAKDISNIVQLPMTASRGIFGGRTQGRSLFEAGKETLATTMTTQEVQSYNVMATGIQRALAGIESSGLAPSNTLMHMMDSVIFKQGDTNFTKLQKLAQTRQIVEAGLEVVLSNDRISEDQRKLSTKILEDIRTAVPFTPAEVLKLGVLQQTDPNATLKSVMDQAKGASIKDQVEALGYTYEPDKYEYRIMNGQLQRKAK